MTYVQRQNYWNRKQVSGCPYLRVRGGLRGCWRVIELYFYYDGGFMTTYICQNSKSYAKEGTSKHVCKPRRNPASVIKKPSKSGGRLKVEEIRLAMEERQFAITIY